PAANPRTADRLLVAAAIVTGLAVGNHSLTLLLGPGILLFVLAVEPGILRRRRFIAACIAAFAIPTVLIRSEHLDGLLVRHPRRPVPRLADRSLRERRRTHRRPGGHGRQPARAARAAG